MRNSAIRGVPWGIDDAQREIDASARVGQEWLRKDTEEHDAFRREQAAEAVAERKRGAYYWGSQGPLSRREPVLPDVTGDRQRAAADAQTQDWRDGQEMQSANDARNQSDATARWNDYVNRLTAQRAAPVAPQAKPVAMTITPQAAKPAAQKESRRMLPPPDMNEILDEQQMGEMKPHGNSVYRKTPQGMERWTGRMFEPTVSFGNWMRDMQSRGIY